MRPSSRSIVWIAAGAAWLGLLLMWSSEITGSVVDNDAAHTLTMAVNLRHHGVISMDEEPPYLPSMYREPAPVLATYLAVSLVDAAHGRAPLQAYMSGERARLLKLQNLFWGSLLTAAAAWAAYLLLRSRILALAAGAMVAVDTVPFAEAGVVGLGLDSLNSDLPAAAVLISAAALLLYALRTGRWAHFALAGLAFGLLALIKASFLYVFVVFAAIVIALAILERKAQARIKPAAAAALIAAFAAMVLPWMIRNYTTLGQFELAERGGSVLYLRAVKNQMTPEEARGALYAWAPGLLQPTLGRVLGFSPADLLRGGRLQRLNRSARSDFYDEDRAAEAAGRPEDAISYYRRARAERVRLEMLALEQGGVEALRLVDPELQRRALTLIGRDPLRHVTLTALFLWRGALVTFPVLLLTLAYAVWRRDRALGLFALPAFGLIMFYALFSHFIARYGAPVLPFVVVCGGVLAVRAAVSLRGRFAREPANAAAHATSG